MAKAATASRPAAKKSMPAKNGMAKKTSASTKLVPLFDGIVIRPTVQEEVLASGIVIPDTAKEKPQQGEVIAVGPGRRRRQRQAHRRWTSQSATASSTRSTPARK